MVANMTPATRVQVIAEARTWLETPWQHQACLKGVACDCAGLIKGVLVSLQLTTPEEWADMPKNYSRWADGTSLRATCERYLNPINQVAAQAGDILLLQTDEYPQHLGILGDYRHGGLSIIHSSNIAHPPRVIETRLMYTRRFKYVAAYQIPGVE